MVRISEKNTHYCYTAPGGFYNREAVCLSRDMSWKFKNICYFLCLRLLLTCLSPQEVRFHYRMSSCQICDRQGDTETGFSPRIPFSHDGNIPQIFHTHFNLIFTFIIQNMNYRDLGNFEQTNALSGSPGHKNTFTFSFL